MFINKQYIAITMLTKTKQKGFFKWISERWYYWVISIVWGILSGYEELRAHYFSEFLGILIASFCIVTFIFLVIWLIKKAVIKEVQKELKAKK